MNTQFLARSYLAQVSESFITKQWELTGTTLLILEIIALTTLVILLIYLIQKRIRTFKRRHASSPFIKKEPKKILDILNKALIDRSKFEVSFSQKQKFSANCSLEDIQKNSLVLELPLNIFPKSNWKGRKIYVYFSVPGEKFGHRTYYFFESEIISFFSKGDINYIIVKIPDYMELKQKRRHFRIEAHNKDFDKIIVYLIRNQAKITNIYHLPKPIFQYIKEKDKGDGVSLDLSIINISAGGIRIKLSNEFKKAIGFDVQNPPDLIIFLKFYNEDKEKRLFLWCKMRNYNEDYITKDLEIGLQFIKQGIIDPRNKTSILWKDINPEDGQDDIGRWVFLKNLYLIRKGIT